MILEIKNLCVSMDNKPLLHNINLKIKSGERHRLAGHNGSGKSTLVNTIAGNPLYSIDSGQIILMGMISLMKTLQIVRYRAFF